MENNNKIDTRRASDMQAMNDEIKQLKNSLIDINGAYKFFNNYDYFLSELIRDAKKKTSNGYKVDIKAKINIYEHTTGRDKVILGLYTPDEEEYIEDIPELHITAVGNDLQNVFKNIFVGDYNDSTKSFELRESFDELKRIREKALDVLDKEKQRILEIWKDYGKKYSEDGSGELRDLNEDDLLSFESGRYVAKDRDGNILGPAWIEKDGRIRGWSEEKEFKLIEDHRPKPKR